MNRIIVENDTMRFYSNPVPIPVGGSQWSKIFFIFSDEWEDLRKIAQFRQGELKRNVDIDSNNFCYVPNEMLLDMCGELSIVGYPQDTSSAVIATANSLMLNFVQGFESGGEPAVPPTPDLYQKLLKEFAEFGGGAADAVTYTPQTPTEEQQEQARTNIGAEKAGTGYTKPASGIPKSDLEQDVQTSLNKADTAISLGLTAATPGQIIKVKAVQDGKPTEWEAVDMAGGEGGEAMDLSWKHIRDVELTPDIIQAMVSTTEAGDAFSYDEIMMEFIPNLEGYFFVRAAPSYGESSNIKVWVTNSQYFLMHLGLLDKKIAITSAFRANGSFGIENKYGGTTDINKISKLVFGASVAVGVAFTVKIWGR